MTDTGGAGSTIRNAGSIEDSRPIQQWTPWLHDACHTWWDTQNRTMNNPN